jgi:RNA polymerase sigma-70 factor (ECF subfamily)
MENNTTDNELMYDFSQCSMDAFKQIFNRYKNRLLNFVIRSFAMDKSDAEDIVQKTLVKVYDYKFKYKARNEFSTWVYTIARNYSINEKKRNRQLSYDQMEEDGKDLSFAASSDSNDDILNKDVSEIFLRELDKIKPKYREVISMRYIQELDFKEIGEILNMNYDTAKSIARRGLSMLKERLTSYKIEV